MDSNALYQPNTYYAPQMMAFTPFIPTVDPGFITSASEQTGLPEWAIVGAAVAAVAFTVLVVVR